MEIRAFFALTLPEAVVRSLADHADTLCQYDVNTEVLWVDSDTYHLTLSFLGDIHLDQVDELEAITREALKTVSSFQVELNETLYYSVSDRLSLVAAQPAPCPPLTQLHDIMVDVGRQVGVEQQDTRYKPHITLGRLEGRLNQHSFKAPSQWPELSLLSLADSVVLFQSKPGQSGSVYTPLFDVPLDDLG